MKKINCLIMLFLLFSFVVTAQRKYDEIINTESTVQDMVQNEITGIVVFKEGNTIKGLNPETKKIVWTITKEDLGSALLSENVLEDSEIGALFKDKKLLSSVPESPYVESYVNSKYIIINTDTGKVVYNSSKESFWVTQSDFIPETDEYLLTLKKGPDVYISLLDTKTGTLKWSTAVDKAKSMFSFSLKESAHVNIAKIKGSVIYYLLYGKLFSFDRATGKLNWKADEEAYTKFFTTQNDKNIVVINSQGLLSTKEYLNVLSTDTGKSIWKESIKTKRVVYLEDWGDRLLIAHFGGFNFFDLKTGQKIWAKDARGDGLKRVIPIDQDFLYVAENEMMLINKNGEKLWKKFIEISDDKEDPIYYLGKVGEKVMYLTGTYGNMVDYKSGKKLWKRNIEFDKNRPVLPTFDESTNSYLVYNDEKLYKFDPTIDDKPEPFAKVNIKREKELNSIELFPWGVALSGPVEVMGVNLDGSVKYHLTYNQPGETGRQIMKGLSMLGSAAMQIGVAASDLKGGEITMISRDQYGNIQETVVRNADKGYMKQANNYALGADAFNSLVEKFGSRFKAMKQNRDFAYIFAKSQTDEKMLVKIRKVDGVELDKITFTNNRPLYEIDPATQNIFYVSGNSIQIFNKK